MTPCSLKSMCYITKINQVEFQPPHGCCGVYTHSFWLICRWNNTCWQIPIIFAIVIFLSGCNIAQLIQNPIELNDPDSDGEAQGPQSGSFTLSKKSGGGGAERKKKGSWTSRKSTPGWFLWKISLHSAEPVVSNQCTQPGAAG